MESSELGESKRFQRDPDERSKKCGNCGHLKVSHKHGNRVIGGRKAVYYSACKKKRCSCDEFVPEDQSSV